MAQDSIHQTSPLPGQSQGLLSAFAHLGFGFPMEAAALWAQHSPVVQFHIPHIPRSFNHVSNAAVSSSQPAEPQV